MTYKAKDSIVVDSNITHAASVKAGFPGNCSHYLTLLYKNNCPVAYTPEIRAEWKNKHLSEFSVDWQYQMHGRKLLVKFETNEFTELRDYIESLDDTPRKQQDLQKDVFLVEAALGSKRIVTSCESNVATLLNSCPASLKKLATVMWFDPTSDINATEQWLNEGCPLKDDCLLQPTGVE